ncbi:MAG: polysaccharide deacetylase family protein [Thiohalomonadales bacterium]
MIFSALMYHSIYRNDEELNDLPEEDRPYAISLDNFQQQLNSLVKNNIAVLDPEIFNDTPVDCIKGNSVLLTFDDGHVSFYRYAYPELVKRNMSGIFFVTSELIKERKDFCSWCQLKEMSDNGMSIQSHGKTHKFISDLNPEEAHDELLNSKLTIESELTSTVNLISFPGGRYLKREIENGLNIGYEYFFTSNEGLNLFNDCAKNHVVKRLAMRCTTSLDEFLKLSKGSFVVIKKRIAIYIVKYAIKKIIGNSVYHFIYKRRRLN